MEFIHGDGETICLVVVFHVEERVVVDVAVKVHVWSALPSVCSTSVRRKSRTRHASTTCTLARADGGKKTEHRAISIYAHIATWICETHARVEPTHIPVGDAAAIDGSLFDHCVPTGRGLLFVDPVRLEPVLVRYLTELDLTTDDVAKSPRTTNVSAYSAKPGTRPIALHPPAERGREWGNVPFELIRERLLVQEHPRILELPIEPILRFPHALQHAIQVTIPREHKHCRVGAFVSIKWYSAGRVALA